MRLWQLKSPSWLTPPISLKSAGATMSLPSSYMKTGLSPVFRPFTLSAMKNVNGFIKSPENNSHLLIFYVPEQAGQTPIGADLVFHCGCNNTSMHLIRSAVRYSSVPPSARDHLLSSLNSAGRLS